MTPKPNTMKSPEEWVDEYDDAFANYNRRELQLLIKCIQENAIASVAQIDDRDAELVNNAIGFWQSAFWEDDIKEPNPATKAKEAFQRILAARGK